MDTARCYEFGPGDIGQGVDHDQAKKAVLKRIGKRYEERDLK